MLRIPLNAIHYYIALPFFLYLAPHGLIQGRKTGNKISLYLGAAGTFFIFALLAYGGPVLFTSDPTILTWGTIIGDFFQSITLFINWLLVARLYFPGSLYARSAVIATGFFFASAAISASILTNIASPTTLISVNGSWMLQYGTSLAYQITNSLLFLSIILTSIRFIIQANSLKPGIQKIRLRTFSGLFLIIGILFVFGPLLSPESTSSTNVYIMAAIFAGLAVLGISTWLIRKMTPTLPNK